ncbi:hypothetical protein RSAG8_07155, partial [Rhizoctonia solani AG-8 WAC10335]
MPQTTTECRPTELKSPTVTNSVSVTHTWPATSSPPHPSPPCTPSRLLAHSLSSHFHATRLRLHFPSPAMLDPDRLLRPFARTN